VTYAIEIKDTNQSECLIIDGEKVVHRMVNNPFLTITRVNLDGLRIEPGHVYFEPDLFDLKTSRERIALFKAFIQKGGTSVVTACQVKNTTQIKKSMAKARHAMINSPIDYILGVTVNIHELTPKLMIELSKQKPPFILFSFTNWEDVYSHTWEWVRDACLGHRPLFIPLWNDNNQRPRETKKRYAEWNNFARTINILTTRPFTTEQPLTLGQLKALGIYPIKGVLQPGADCDYALYPSLLDGTEPNRYDEHTPSIVVVRGKIQFAGQDVYRPGYGRELKIRLPYRFTDYWECISNNG
jgi:hypothetical protein